jgi:hypothetical protein
MPALPRDLDLAKWAAARHVSAQIKEGERSDRALALFKLFWCLGRSVLRPYSVVS